MSVFRYLEDGESLSLEFSLDSNTLQIGEKSYPCDNQSVLIDGRRVPFWTHKGSDRVLVWLDGEVFQFEVKDPRQRAGGDSGGAASGNQVKAQMPGKVLTVSVTEGAEVKKGDNLVIMESMKMELSLDAPRDGKVEKVLVEAGQMVGQGDTLVQLGEDE